MTIRCIVVLFFTCIASSTFSQSKAFKKAIAAGKSPQLFYEASFKKIYSERKITKWIESNNYVVLAYLKEEIARFGGYEQAIVGVRFVTHNDYQDLLEQERKRRAYNIAKKRESENWKDLLTIGAIVAAVAGTKWVISNSFSMPNVRSQPCVKEERLINKKAFVFNDNQGAEISRPVYKIRCHNERIKYYYELEEELKSEDRQSYKKGFREYIESSRAPKDGGFLSTNKYEAFDILCNCN